MCYSTETEQQYYNVVVRVDATKAKAEELAKAINVLTDFEYNAEVVEAE